MILADDRQPAGDVGVVRASRRVARLKRQRSGTSHYEHCSYFTTGSLARLFRRTGSTAELEVEYDGEYIVIRRQNHPPRQRHGSCEAKMTWREVAEEVASSRTV